MSNIKDKAKIKFGIKIDIKIIHSDELHNYLDRLCKLGLATRDNKYYTEYFLPKTSLLSFEDLKPFQKDIDGIYQIAYNDYCIKTLNELYFSRKYIENNNGFLEEWHY